MTADFLNRVCHALRDENLAMSMVGISYVLERLGWSYPEDREDEAARVLSSAARAWGRYLFREGTDREILQTVMILDMPLNAFAQGMIARVFEGSSTEAMCNFFKAADAARVNMKLGRSKTFPGRDAGFISNWVAIPIERSALAGNYGVQHLSYSECSAGVLCEVLNSRTPDSEKMIMPPHIFRMKKRWGLVSFDPPITTCLEKILYA
jgi:hypothetical protein